jgi:predicted dehydrogenase
VAMGDDFDFRGSGQLTIYGDRGLLTITLPIEGGPDRAVIERNGVREILTAEGKQQTPAEAFVAAILDGAPVPATVADAAHVVAFVQGVYQSAAERRVVRLAGAG